MSDMSIQAINKFFLAKYGVKFTCLLAFLFLSITSFSGELPRPNNFGGDFTFDSSLAKRASLSDWKGKIVLLSFGFTSCPDVCPLVLSKLSLVQNQLDKDANKIQVIFVSIDPERDSIEKIRNYLQAYHSGFVGMRGSDTEVATVLKRYGASVEVYKSEPSNDISHSDISHSDISHSDYVYIIDEQGYVAGFYDVKSDYTLLLNAVKQLM